MSWASLAGSGRALPLPSWLAQECRQAWRPFWCDDTPSAPQRAGQAAMLLRTSYFRQAAGFAYVFLLVTLGSIIWGQHLLEQVLTSHVKDMVAAETRAHQMLDGEGSARRLAQAFGQREAAVARRERAAAVQGPDGTLFYGNADLLSPALCAPQATPCQGWLRERQTGADGTVREWLGRAYTLPDGGRYVIAYDVLPMLDRIYPVPLAGGLSVFLVLLASLGVGLYFSLGAVRRIDRIRQAMGRFARGDMDARVPLLGRHDEFDQLGQDVNQALARINHLMEEVRNATNHIAHELRTPLTRLQQRLSNVAEAARDDRAVCAELALAEEETQRIQYLFRAVMRISEIETGRCHHEAVPIDARELLADLHDYYGVLAEQRGLSLQTRIEGPPRLVGDRALLFQALVNLVDNAIKHAPTGSTITLLARRQPQGTALGVADEGPGIDASQRGQAVQRFRRLTRDRAIAGHGLGLALVKAVAGLHGGRLTLSDNDLRPADAARRGLLAVLHLPLAPAPVPPRRQPGLNLNDS